MKRESFRTFRFDVTAAGVVPTITHNSTTAVVTAATTIAVTTATAAAAIAVVVISVATTDAVSIPLIRDNKGTKTVR